MFCVFEETEVDHLNIISTERPMIEKFFEILAEFFTRILPTPSPEVLTICDNDVLACLVARFTYLLE